MSVDAHLAAQRWLLRVALAGFATGASQHVFYRFESRRGDFDSLSSYLRWTQAEAGDVYLATQFRTGCSTGYFGGQMHEDGSHLVLFSMWDVEGMPHTALGISPWCTRFGHEGAGAHCGLNYVFEFGLEYRFRLTKRRNGTGVLWSTSVSRMDPSGAETDTFLGTIFIDARKLGADCSLLPANGMSFQEYYLGGSFYSAAAWRGPFLARGLARVAPSDAGAECGAAAVPANISSEVPDGPQGPPNAFFQMGGSTEHGCEDSMWRHARVSAVLDRPRPLSRRPTATRATGPPALGSVAALRAQPSGQLPAGAQAGAAAAVRGCALQDFALASTLGAGAGLCAGLPAFLLGLLRLGGHGPPLSAWGQGLCRKEACVLLGLLAFIELLAGADPEMEHRLHTVLLLVAPAMGAAVAAAPGYCGGLAAQVPTAMLGMVLAFAVYSRKAKLRQASGGWRPYLSLCEGSVAAALLAASTLYPAFAVLLVALLPALLFWWPRGLMYLWGRQVTYRSVDGGEPLQCPSGHKLQGRTAASSGFCDRCGRHIEAGEQIMDCDACNWWVCEACHSEACQSCALLASARSEHRGGQGGRQCPMQHRLEPSKAPSRGYCDVCQKSVQAGEDILDCRQCDWYVCQACQGSAGSPDECQGPPPKTAEPITPSQTVIVSADPMVSSASGDSWHTEPPSAADVPHTDIATLPGAVDALPARSVAAEGDAGPSSTSGAEASLL